MRIVVRYEFPVGEFVPLRMRRTGRIIGMDGHIDGKPILWAEEDPDDSVVIRDFRAVPPMWQVPNDSIRYVGRYLLNFVTYNVYEVFSQAQNHDR